MVSFQVITAAVISTTVFCVGDIVWKKLTDDSEVHAASIMFMTLKMEAASICEILLNFYENITPPNISKGLFSFHISSCLRISRKFILFRRRVKEISDRTGVLECLVSLHSPANFIL
jgi:hypothetical protein